MAKTIILSCIGGLTTSMLVERMNEVIHKDQLDLSVYSVGITGIDTLKNVDVLLLGPQLAYLKEKSEGKLNIPVAVISDEDFEQMQGEQVLRQAIALIEGR
ncbi:MAG: PTS sugar transporter subunit IIB [Aerococcaceae bacterium]|nr:PTS sugar transporter subunit IIB [Aerococcaceae bacterium]